MYQEGITKENAVKLRSLYIKCLKLRCLCIRIGSPKKVAKLRSLDIVFKVALCIRSGSPKNKLQSFGVVYQVLQVALFMYQEWINKEEVVKLRSPCIKCLKLRCLSIKSGSQKEQVVLLRSLYTKCLKLRCVCIKARLHRRFLSRQLDAIFMYQERITKKIVAKSVYQVFKVSVSMYQEWIFKEQVVK